VRGTVGYQVIAVYAVAAGAQLQQQQHWQQANNQHKHVAEGCCFDYNSDGVGSNNAIASAAPV
jgi:hypothetical protein